MKTPAVIVWLLISLWPWGEACAATPPPKPNIVVFIADDHGWGDSEVYGAADVKTPHLLRLAQSGMTFTRAFVASPSCAPSRAALLTGLMPARNGAEANHSKPRAEIKKLPAYLQELGYEVAAFGKVAHYNHDEEYGFNHYDKRHAREVVAQFLSGRDSSKPLCLFVGSHAPHVPWSTNSIYDPAAVRIPSTHVDTAETRHFRSQYYTDVTKADSEIGDTLELARGRFGTNLVFVYTSDHGAQWPFGKWNLYDAGIRVPFIMAWPGVAQPGGKTEAMISWTDILPTLIEIAGGAAPKNLDGHSFLPVLRGQTNQHRARVFATHSGDGKMNVYPMRAVRTAEWKYILNLHPEFAYTTHIDLARERDGVKYWRSWVDAGRTDSRAARIVKRYTQRPAEELYSLRDDPFEERNLAADPAQKERLAAFRNELENWMREQGDRRTVFETPRLLDKGASN